MKPKKKKKYLPPKPEIHKFKKFFYFCLCDATQGTDCTNKATTILDAGVCMT